MKRNAFLKQTGALAMLSMLPIELYTQPLNSNFPMGLQLYTVRDVMEKDPVGTLKKLKGMGYTDFETYGFNVAKKTYYGYSALDFKNILLDLGLTTYSGHYGLPTLMEVGDNTLKRYVDTCIEAALTMGDAYITWPKLDEAYRNAEGYALLVKKLNTIGAQISAAGLGFAYHNFGYDFNTYAGKTGMDWVLEETHPDWVKIEVDFYWVMHAGVVTPKALIEKAPGRFPLWHIKDMAKITKDYTELGNGVIDYSRILPETKKSGLERYYLEQGGNFAKNSLQSVSDSAAFFKRHIQKQIS